MKQARYSVAKKQHKHKTTRRDEYV